MSSFKRDLVRHFHDLACEVRKQPIKYISNMREVLQTVRQYVEKPEIFGESYPHAVLSIFRKHPLIDYYHVEIGLDERKWDGLAYTGSQKRSGLDALLVNGAYIGIVGNFQDMVLKTMRENGDMHATESGVCDELQISKICIPEQEFVWISTNGQSEAQCPPLWLAYSEVKKGSPVAMPRRAWTAGKEVFE